MNSSANPETSQHGAKIEDAEAFPLFGLVALAAAIFISMVTEFLPGGLIPLIAADFDRSVSDVGNLVTVFAATVIVTAAPAAILTRRIPRKPLILVTLGMIGLGNIATVFSPSFEFMLGARIFGAFAHGLFWSVVAAYPAHLVRASQLGKAMAITAAGGSVSGIVGIPLGNALGQAYGWRVSFGIVAVLVLLVGVFLAWKLPNVVIKPKEPAPEGNASKAKVASTLPAILIVCLLILLAVGAQNSYGTFTVVWLQDVANLAPATIPIVLFISGIAGAVGVAITGALYSRYPAKIMMVSLAGLVLLLALFPVAANNEPAVWLMSGLMSMIFGGVPVMLQTRMMATASAEQRNLAAALQTTAFNVGIGGGTFIGGLAISWFSLGNLPTISAVLMFAALIVAAIWEILARQRRVISPILEKV